MPKKKKQEDTSNLSREERLSQIFKQAEKNYGTNVLGYGDSVSLGIPRVSTGVFVLDYTLGGGLPVGRISMFYGPKSSSKTTCFLRSAGIAQQMCSNCWTIRKPVYGATEDDIHYICDCGDYRETVVAWIDAEGAWDNEWSRKFLDTSKVVLSQPESGEQASDVVDVLLRSGDVDIVVLDSFANMIPTTEIEKSSAEMTVGDQAKLINKTMRKVVSAMNMLGSSESRRPTLWTINQIRQKIGVMFGNPETTPGGDSPRFANSTETRMSQGKFKFDEDNSKPSSVVLKVKNYKNKTGTPGMEGEYSMSLVDSELRRVGDVMDEEYTIKLGQQMGLIDVGKNRATYKGVDYDGKSVLARHWMENKDEYWDYKEELMRVMIYGDS